MEAAASQAPTAPRATASHLGLTIKDNGTLYMVAFIDASFAVHKSSLMPLNSPPHSRRIISEDTLEALSLWGDQL